MQNIKIYIVNRIVPGANNFTYELDFDGNLNLSDSLFDFNNLYTYTFTKSYSFNLPLTHKNRKYLLFNGKASKSYEVSIYVDNVKYLNGSIIVNKVTDRSIEVNFIDNINKYSDLLKTKIGDIKYTFKYDLEQRTLTNYDQTGLTIDTFTKYFEVDSYFNDDDADKFNIDSAKKGYITAIGLADAYAKVNTMNDSTLDYTTRHNTNNNNGNILYYRNFSLSYNPILLLREKMRGFDNTLLDINQLNFKNIEIDGNQESITSLLNFTSTKDIDFTNAVLGLRSEIQSVDSGATPIAQALLPKPYYTLNNNILSAVDETFNKDIFSYYNSVDDNNYYNYEYSTSYLNEIADGRYVYYQLFNAVGTVKYDVTLFNKDGSVKVKFIDQTQDSEFFIKLDKFERIEFKVIVYEYKKVDRGSGDGFVFDSSFDFYMVEHPSIFRDLTYDIKITSDKTITDLIKTICDISFCNFYIEDNTIFFMSKRVFDNFKKYNSLVSSTDITLQDNFDVVVYNFDDTYKSSEAGVSNDLKFNNIFNYDLNKYTSNTKIYMDLDINVSSMTGATGETIMYIDDAYQLETTTGTTRIVTTRKQDLLTNVGNNPDDYIDIDVYEKLHLYGNYQGLSFDNTDKVKRSFEWLSNEYTYYYDLNTTFNPKYYNRLNVNSDLTGSTFVKNQIGDEKIIRIVIPTNDGFNFGIGFGDTKDHILIDVSNGEIRYTFDVFNFFIGTTVDTTANKNLFLNELVNKMNTGLSSLISGDTQYLPFAGLLFYTDSTLSSPTSNLFIKKRNLYVNDTDKPNFSNNESITFNFTLFKNPDFFDITTIDLNDRESIDGDIFFTRDKSVFEGMDWPLPIYSRATKDIIENSDFGYEYTSNSKTPVLSIIDNDMNIKQYVSGLTTSSYNIYPMKFDFVNFLTGTQSMYFDIEYQVYTNVSRRDSEGLVTGLLRWLPATIELSDNSNKLDAFIPILRPDVISNRDLDLTEYKVVNINNNKTYYRPNFFISFWANLFSILPDSVITTMPENINRHNLSLSYFKDEFYIYKFNVRMDFSDYINYRYKTSTIIIDDVRYLMKNIQYNVNSKLATIECYKYMI